MKSPTFAMPDQPVSRYWLIVAARDHVQKGVEGGFCQANHGKARNLKRMQKGDGVVFYSPKEAYGNPKPLQAFTALGHVSDDEVYQSPMAPDFEPFRRDIQFEHVQETPIQPLIAHLDFIRSKTNWGMTFRFGFLEISAADFDRIAREMRAA